MDRILGLYAGLVVITGCGGSKPPAPPIAPVASEQEICQQVAERVVERFVSAAAATWAATYPDVPVPSTKLEGDHRTMMVTVMFDSCFAEWPAPVRSCFLKAAPDAPIESCQLAEPLRAGAIRRTTSILYSLQR